MLHSLKVKSIRLLTNNPKKIGGLKQVGVKVAGRIPLVIPPNPYNSFYLETKRSKSGHLIDRQGKERLAEQLDRPVVAGMSEEQAAGIQD